MAKDIQSDIPSGTGYCETISVTFLFPDIHWYSSDRYIKP